MKRPVLVLLCAAMALALFSYGAFALSAGDSLISLDYLKNTFFPQAVGQGEQAADKKLEIPYNQAVATLDALQKSYLAGAGGEEHGAYSPTLSARLWNEGDRLELPTGSGALLLRGSATVQHDGVFLDVTDGREVASGSPLIQNHRYLAGENTKARLEVRSGVAQLGVQGGYELTAGNATAAPFYDIAQSDWFYAPVNYVYARNLFSGMGENEFAPQAAMNRAMLMTVLYRMSGASAGELNQAEVSFTDVPSAAWYAPYVKWGAYHSITAGTGAGTFSPERQVTREQVVALLYSFASNYLKMDLTSRADLSAYQDLAQASQWSHDAFAWAVSQGVVSSSSANALTLSPQKNANRAEVATMLKAFSEIIQGAA